MRDPRRDRWNRLTPSGSSALPIRQAQGPEPVGGGNALHQFRIVQKLGANGMISGGTRPFSRRGSGRNQRGGEGASVSCSDQFPQGEYLDLVG
jgi:hypothetical protein